MHGFLAGGGEMGELMRSHDWASTPLGPPEAWPQSLRSAVSILLPSGAQICLFWGPDLVTIYNDGYRPALGVKHPWALGRPARETWSEFWDDVLRPLLEGVLETGEAFWASDYPFPLERHGYPEETYFDISYDPVRDESGKVGGVFCIVSETTGRVVGQRRLKTLREVTRVAAEAQDTADAFRRVGLVLGENAYDLPFALLYEKSTSTSDFTCAASSGIEVQASEIWGLGVSGAPLEERVLDEEALGSLPALPSGPWPEPVRSVAILPIVGTGQEPLGALVAGVSPRRELDESYLDFLRLVAANAAAAVVRARALAEERRRAEALAELDRAKTLFFSNISHEFRTPLTLMLGPLDDLLTTSGQLSEDDRERVELAQRNALRLLKLVNTLLDFSRIEAGRIEASYEPTELCALTAELASVFRSAIERAGMKLAVDCPAPAEPVYVDREMWEKIVLNLLSNAFKFTFAGEISVSLRLTDAAAELVVRDTGTGIPADEIPRLFERFHRVKGARGRSYEGSGIGLALVQELVRLHGGTVRVESRLGEGSSFVVSIPRGTAHLPAERIGAARTMASTALQSDVFVDEMLRWADTDDERARFVPPPDSTRALARVARSGRGERILLADDNADVRSYLGHLLSGYDVETVADGEAALEAARRRRPDLVLTDVMMPRMDGFELLRAIRADETLKDVPVIILSARAGEDARVEGLAAGADDYLVKPFSARELAARVESNLSMARLRREITDTLRYRSAQFETLLNRAPLGILLLGPDLVIREVNPVAVPEIGDLPGGIVGRHVTEVVRNVWQPPYAEEVLETVQRTLETGEPFAAARWTGVRADLGIAAHYEWKLDRIILPDGEFGLVCYFRDISEQVQAEETRQLLLRELNHRVKNTLSTVQAIAQQTLRRTLDPTEFAARFSGRIHSLARVHSLLTEASWHGAGLADVIHDQLLEGGTADAGRITARGPAVHLSAQKAVHFALMLHELATNSAKYGALSTADGNVAITWSLDDHDLHLTWVERGGPPVVAPTTRGFGTTLIEQSARGEGGAARVLYEADGVTWDIRLPLVRIGTSDRGGSDSAPGNRGPKSEAREPPSRLAGRRILVVDDEPLIALELADAIRRGGAEVAGPAGSEAEALRIIEQGKLDAALLDANLHGRSADPIASALMKAGVPFAFVTGYGTDTLETGFREAPVLTKPVAQSRILDTLSRMLSRDGRVVPIRHRGDARH
jgi:signal transduction histidine kinase/DNA-binding response OmpR family regulator